MKGFWFKIALGLALSCSFSLTGAQSLNYKRHGNERMGCFACHRDDTHNSPQALKMLFHKNTLYALKSI